MEATHAVPTSVRFGHGLVTFLLFGALLFGALTIASVAVGVVRDGDSILYGDTFGVPAELSPESLQSAVPKGVELTGQTPVQVTVHDPTVRQMFLRHAADFGAVLLTIIVAWLLRALT